MTDEEFVAFIRSCPLSNEDIASCFCTNPLEIRSWRNGTEPPNDGQEYGYIVRQLSMLVHIKINEEIQNYHDRRFPK